MLLPRCARRRLSGTAGDSSPVVGILFLDIIRGGIEFPACLAQYLHSALKHDDCDEETDGEETDGDEYEDDGKSESKSGGIRKS